MFGFSAMLGAMVSAQMVAAANPEIKFTELPQPKNDKEPLSFGEVIFWSMIFNGNRD